MDESKNIPMDKKQVADLYGISRVTLNKWLKPFEEYIGKPMGRIYTPEQVRRIKEKLGEP